jgi:hypothetical protein
VPYDRGGRDKPSHDHKCVARMSEATSGDRAFARATGKVPHIASLMRATPFVLLRRPPVVLHQHENLLEPRHRIAGFEEFLALADLDRHQRRN